MSARGFILQPTYRIRNGVPVVHLHGKLTSGEPFVVEDERFRPYFFVHTDVARIFSRDRGVRVEESQLRDLRGAPVARVIAEIPGDVPRLRERVERASGEALEADIRFAYRYLIDHGIRGAVEIEGEPERMRSGLLRFRNPELSPAEGVRPELDVISLDIETTPDASHVLSFALFGAGADEVHLVGRAPEGAVGYVEEAELLRALVKRLTQLDPDVITGWNVVDFDLRVLDRRCAQLGVAFEIGRIPGRIGFQRDATFTRQSRADVPGRQVLDGAGLLRDAFVTLDDYSLETAARAVLGRGKAIDETVVDRPAEIQRLYREAPDEFVAYNREDARLALEILERESLIDLVVERSLLCGMQLDRVNASIASFDLVYLPELRRRGFVAPSVDRERKSARVTGGAVLEGTPGLYRNVAVYDFKSLYPSLMRTFNLDPLAHAQANCDSIEAPNGAHFSRDRAILPDVLERFYERREEAKRRGDQHADLAIKIMMNALFGVLGAASCRFFDPEVANAITTFGQQTLHWTREALEAEAAEVLYGDTDSLFVALDPEASGERARRDAEALRERMQGAISKRVREAYGVTPQLDLELERIYSRFFLPSLRGSQAGSKKRYAGLVEGELEIVGLESVRSDWPAVAKRLQQGMLARLFRDEPVLPYVQEIVEQLRSGELDAELVIRKRLRKGSVERYTASTPPHIKAARKAGGAVDRVVRYVIAATGPEPVLPGRPFPEKLDREHYVEKVLRPIADAILQHTDQSFDEALGRPRQLSLL